jgi:hypothetical protein
LARLFAPVDSAAAHVMLKIAVGATGEKAAQLIPEFLSLHMGHVHVHEVLHGVLHPEAIINLKKKEYNSCGAILT